MLGVGPMTYQAIPRPKKPKSHARGATIPGSPTPGPFQTQSTPASQSSGFGGFVNAQVPQFSQSPQLPSSPSLQTTGSFDSSNFHTGLSDTSAGTKKSGGFFRLFKKDSRSDGARSNEDLPSRGKALYSRSDDPTVETESEPEPFDPLDEMGILSPPDFIRPMPGQRLVPRGEPNALRRMTSSPIGNTQIGRARARAAARLNESISEVLESDWQTTTGDEEQSSPVDLSSFYNEPSQEFNVITDPEEQHEFIAVASAPAGDNAAISEWTNYIKSYSSGSFNISKPPAPPPRSMHFEYLPAMYPHDEESRIAKHYSIDAPWTPELGGKIIALMGAAAKRFRLSCASVSAFDEWHEILRVEVGYNLMKLDRTTSISAHALYSEEVLVILDTHQDWRFAGNPWVTGSPHIRFFAGAPLISDSGEIIGVFSIHSKQPRSEFSRVDRRELAEFAALSVKDICLHGERMLDPDLRRSLAVSKRDTRTNLVPNPLHFQKKSSTLVTQPAFFPMGLQYQTHSSPFSKQSEFSNEDSFVNTPETSISMSHESSIRDSDILYMAAPGHYRSVSAESAFTNHNSPEAFHQYLTPTRSQNFPGAVDPDSRPYSTSDLTSVDMPQNNTPNDTFYSDDSYSHYQLDLDGPTTPKQPKFVFPNTVYRNLGPSASGISLNNSFGRLYMEGDSMAGSNYHQELLEPDVARRSTSLTRPFSTISSTSIRTSFSSKIGGPNQGDENTTYNAPRSNIAEAAFSCSFSGRQFGFDQTFAVQVDCPYPGMSDRDLLGPHGLNLKILASYGLPYGYESELTRNLSLKTAFLKGLRTNEFCYIWTQDETSETYQQEGSLDFGVLMPLCPLSQTRSRDHGIVYAMFKKVNLSSHNNLQRTDVDLHGLKCAANSMTILLFNLEIGDVETQSFARQKIRRQGTPTIIGATEVGQIYYSRRSPSAYSRHSSF
ncbi:676d3e83-757c-465f-95cb-42456426a20e [Sclerotinia trifoliorum]|uniref:676d3e83-757c-465f-95cb-42456426a20e n=1 Tax=Sclerotinia trifoliorum TaxID=28548 RepID=A0A8H2ZVB3_9HELO|nr:676d3e83-757c-465f-95cb-42456426a20e [Sclerotinia trifoliorum]